MPGCQGGKSAKKVENGEQQIILVSSCFVRPIVALKSMFNYRIPDLCGIMCNTYKKC